MFLLCLLDHYTVLGIPSLNRFFIILKGRPINSLSQDWFWQMLLSKRPKATTNKRTFAYLFYYAHT